MGAEVTQHPFITRPWSGLVGGTDPNQRVTAENIDALPPGSTVRCGENESEWLIHLHDGLWVRIFGCGYCYDRAERFHYLLPGRLCHQGPMPEREMDGCDE